MIIENSYKIKGGNQNMLQISYVKTLDLMPNEYNPNSHGTKSFDMLIRSVGLFGFTQPIVVDKKTMTIIDGEHRWRVACVLDYEYVPVCFVSLNDEQKRLATILHNEARGKHSKLALNKIDEYLKTKGINMDDELLSKREN